MHMSLFTLLRGSTNLNESIKEQLVENKPKYTSYNINWLLVANLLL